jgi:hypothetical protein
VASPVPTTSDRTLCSEVIEEFRAPLTAVSQLPASWAFPAYWAVAACCRLRASDMAIPVGLSEGLLIAFWLEAWSCRVDSCWSWVCRFACEWARII